MAHAKDAVELVTVADHACIFTAMPEDALKLVAFTHHPAVTAADDTVAEFVDADHADTCRSLRRAEHAIHCVALARDTDVIRALAEDAVEIPARPDHSARSRAVAMDAVAGLTRAPDPKATLVAVLALDPSAGAAAGPGRADAHAQHTHHGVALASYADVVCALAEDAMEILARADHAAR